MVVVTSTIPRMTTLSSGSPDQSMTTLSSVGGPAGRLPTMVDVARAAGTSQKTVSRVGNA